jgi:hypothetical protein
VWETCANAGVVTVKREVEIQSAVPGVFMNISRGLKSPGSERNLPANRDTISGREICWNRKISRSSRKPLQGAHDDGLQSCAAHPLRLRVAFPHMAESRGVDAPFAVADRPLERPVHLRDRVVAVNVDDPEGAKAVPIAERFGVNYPMLIGDENTGRRFGGVWALPTSFIIGRDGKVKEKLQGLYPPELLESKVVQNL